MRRTLLPPNHELGWTPFAWLIYLVLLPLALWSAGATSREWLISAVAVVAFLPLYFRGYWLRGRSLVANCCLIAALALVLWPFNPGAAVLFVYAAGALGPAGPPRVGFRWVVLFMAVQALAAWVLSVPLYWWLPSFVFTFLIGGVNIHFAEVGRARAKVQLAQEEVEQLAKVAERERIARDLHDLLGHTLSLITLKAELAGRLVEGDPQAARKEIGDVETASRKALSQVRRAVRGYRSRGLVAEVANARMALDAAAVELVLDGTPPELSPSHEGVAALALREAVTNVVRHAGASRCEIRFSRPAGGFRLDVADDGRGGEAPDGSGLAGMRERVEALGGSLSRQSERGTRLSIYLPAPDGGAADSAPSGELAPGGAAL